MMNKHTFRAKEGRTRYSIICPNCFSQLVIRVSKRESPLTRASHVQCPNPACQAGYKASIELIQITQSPINDFGHPMPPAATEAEKKQIIQDIEESRALAVKQKNLF